MTRRNGVPRIFFGWWIVLASGLITFWGEGVSRFAFSALFKPIASELGFSRAATSVAAGVKTLEGGFLSPVVGWVTDKFGPRWIVFSGVFIAGLSLILMNFVNSLWAFYLVWGLLLGTGSNLSLALPLDRTITSWFIKKRGRALTIKWVFWGLSAVLMLPIVAWLISTQGWRTTCVIAGLVMWIIGLPLAWFFIKQHRPEYYGMLPDGATTRETTEVTQMIDRGVKYAIEVDEVEFTLRQSMRTPAYWLLILTNATFGASVGSVFLVHGMPFITDMGVEPVKAAMMIGLMSASCIPGFFVGGLVTDRVKKQHLRFILGGSFLLHLISVIAFLLSPTLTLVYPLFILHHFAGGVFGPIQSVITARYFGRKAFGSIRGTLLMFILPASVASPVYAGWVYDTTGSYMTVFLVCAVLLTFATTFISLASPPKPPAQVSDIRKFV